MFAAVRMVRMHVCVRFYVNLCIDVHEYERVCVCLFVTLKCRRGAKRADDPHTTGRGVRAVRLPVVVVR